MWNSSAVKTGNHRSSVCWSVIWEGQSKGKTIFISIHFMWMSEVGINLTWIDRMSQHRESRFLQWDKAQGHTSVHSAQTQWHACLVWTFSPPFPKFATLETNALATYSSQIVPMILEFCNGLDFRTCFLFTRCFRCCDHHGGFDTGIWSCIPR